MSKALHLILYSRPGCHLCEDMVLELEPYTRLHEFDYEIVNVDGNPELKERFGMDVPVLSDDAGRIICMHRLDKIALDTALNRQISGGHSHDLATKR